MDKIELKNGFISNLICKIIVKKLYKKFGTQIKMSIQNLDVASQGDDVNFRFDVTGSMKKDDLEKMISKLISG